MPADDLLVVIAAFTRLVADQSLNAVDYPIGPHTYDFRSRLADLAIVDAKPRLASRSCMIAACEIGYRRLWFNGSSC